MTDRFCRLYTTDHGAGRINAVLDHMAAQGLTLELPGSERIDIVAPDGQQHATNRGEFSALLATEPDVSFMLWRNDGSGMYCQARRVSHLRSIEFSLDGTTAEEMEEFIRGVLSVVLKLAKDGGIEGVIIDRNDFCVEGDWDSFFLRNRLPYGPIPSILGVKLAQARPLYSEFASVHRTEADGFVLFQSPC